MIVVYTTQIRPDVNTPFYIETNQELRSAFGRVVSTSPYLIDTTFTLSPDSLEHVSIARYESQEDLDLFLSNLNVSFPTFFDDRAVYSEAQGIQISRGTMTL